MRKSFLLSAFLLVMVVACHSKKEIAKSTSYEPTDAQITAGKTQFPDLTRDNLIRGYSIYYGVCTNCHEAKSISDYSQEEFSDILNKMARKAKLTTDEKYAVWKYAVSIKLSK